MPNILHTLSVCRERIHHHSEAWAGRIHLVYFAAVAVEGHGVYGWAALVCLGVGLAAESTGASNAR
ncbi:MULTISPECIES: hypothetical protein [unclassified Sphingomonas]|uniref:hypothetical protein n=1 Tax=unclassified Sphingomonas TaxID=196159 RepID=UPI002151B3EE|nr:MULTISPECIES: hypothetical protein [unclassified Sphingomonas]MCR5870653.1 hypothetical protein [Sphingomonas sp. J344]UUY01008.1 hypothetical protein LRS08_08125 [Sphingomonas sp. J315]